LLLLATVLAGVATVTLLAQLAGPEYRARAQIILGGRDTSSVLTGTPGELDPQLRFATDAELAESPEFRDRVARRVGTRGQLEGDFSFEPESGTSLVTVFGMAADARLAIELANAAAAEFPSFRREVLSRPIRTSREDIERALVQSPGDRALRETLSRLRVLESLSGGVAVVTTARRSARVRPAPLKDTLIGLSAGLVVGLLLVALREGLANRVRGEQDVEDLLATPVLATVPAPARGRRFGRGRRSAGGTATERVARMAFDRVARSLEDASQRDRGTVVAIVSATSGEGRTTTAERLASAFDARGASVCVVHAFDVAPAIVRVPSSAGVDVSESESAPAVAKFEAVVPVWALVGRHSRTAVSDPRSPPDVIGGARLAATLRDEYEWVVVDTPPALQSAVAEELTRSVDAIVLVVRPSVVTRRQLSDLARQIGMWRRRPLGVVVTGQLNG